MAHVQSGEVLAVGGTFDVRVAVVVELLDEGPADADEVGDGAVVHNCVPAEDERVVVHAGDGGCGCGSDMCEDGGGGGVGAEGAEVGVVEGWLGIFVQ